MVEFQPSKLATRVRFPPPAPFFMGGSCSGSMNPESIPSSVRPKLPFQFMANLFRGCFLRKGALGPALLLGGIMIGAVRGDERASLALNLENDVVVGEDRHYTHGAHFYYWSRDSLSKEGLTGAANISDYLPRVGLEIGAVKWGADLGQEIYTPSDLNNPAVIQDDRPFAGWFYSTLKLERRGTGMPGLPVLETFRLDLGVVGPAALGRQAQEWIHHQEPVGWKNQLNNEPGLAFRYDRRVLFSLPLGEGAWRFHFIPEAGGSAGNVDTHLGGGGTLQFGWHPPDDFAWGPEASGHRPDEGFYLLAGAEGRWVIRNIFLDGNTWQSSHHVDKEPLVAEYTVGIGFVLKSVEIRYVHVFRTREFKQQGDADNFGSVTVTYKF
jgi:lipid A 3-O-deacylase